VGVDLGGSNCRMLAVDLLGQVMGRARKPTPARLSTRRLAAWVGDEVRALVERPPFLFVTVGLPGIVDIETSAVRAAPNLPQVEGLDFVAHLRSQLPATVGFDNDSNLAALGEMRLGAAQGKRSAVMFTIGAGLGAGVVLDHRLLRGRTGLVGEFGYLPFGGRGEALEEILSARGLVAAAQRRGIEIPSPEAIFAAPALPPLRAVRARFEDGLLLAVVAATAAYEPEVVVLGGGVADSLAAVLPRLQARLRAAVPNPPEVRLSSLGDLAGAIGAVISGLHDAYIAVGVDPSLLDGSVGPGLEGLQALPGKGHADVP